MNFKDVQDRTIFLTISGSHAYGMNRPDSDYDYRGIIIPPIDNYIGLQSKFEQIVDSHKGKHVYTYYDVGLLETDPRVEGNDPNEAPDMQVTEITKFMKLALQNNPSILEILFTDSKFWVKYNPIMDPIMENRDKLLCKQAKARFLGYAMQQLKRIRAHRRWLVNPIEKKPTRAEYGLPETSLVSRDQLGAAEALIQKELNEFMVEQTDLPEHTKIDIKSSMYKILKATWDSINDDKEFPIGSDKKYRSNDEAIFWGLAKNQYFSDNFLEILDKEKRYRTAMIEWDQFQTWKKNRNKKRAEMEKEFGYDLKHAAHLVRLIKCAKEILQHGTLTVSRPDVDELIAIRNGAWSYEELIEFSEKQDQELQEITKASKVPNNPPFSLFDQITRKMIIEFNDNFNY